MCSDRTREDVWFDQVTMRRARGLEQPTQLTLGLRPAGPGPAPDPGLTAETEADLREVLGDAAVDEIKAELSRAETRRGTAEGRHL
jgi:hypothetical protein